MINRVLDESVTTVDCMSSLYSYFNNNYSKYIARYDEVHKPIACCKYIAEFYKPIIITCVD